jgi:hypothetical protein
VVEADIGEDCSGTEVCLVTQDGVADIIEVGDLRLIEDKAVLELAGVPKDDAITDNDVLPDIGAVTDLASLTDPSRPLDHGTLLDDRTGSDINCAANKGFADQFAMDPGLETELEIGRDLRKGLPSMGNILEDDTVLRAVEIEERVGREHGDEEKTTERKEIWNSGKQEEEMPEEILQAEVFARCFFLLS